MKNNTSGLHSSEVDKTNAHQLLMHIHEQYAVNQNSSLNSLITLFATLLIVVGAFGCVYVEYLDDWSVWESLNLTVTTIACNMVIAIMILYINLYQGFHLRKEQFTVYKIRRYFQLYKCKIEGNVEVIDWTPYDKNLFDFCQGPYDVFTKILLIVAVIISLSAIVPLCAFGSYWEYVSLVLLSFTICLIILGWTLKYYFSKYSKIAKNYSKSK